MSVCLRTKAACKLAETFRSTMYAPEDSEDNIDGFMRGRYDGLSYIIISERSGHTFDIFRARLDAAENVFGFSDRRHH